MTRTLTTQVLVVGAGPVGLLTAGELCLGGARVMVIDRLEQPTSESRASVLHARTMEIFDSRGLLPRFGELPTDIRGHFGGMALDLTLPGPYPGQWKVPQVRTEAVLADWALSMGADLRRGHELAGLTVRPDRVCAEVISPVGQLRIRADYVVGCDGENSTVRKLAGICLAGEEPRRELLRADVADIEIPGRRFQRLPTGLANAARNASGVTRVMVHEFGRRPSPRSAAPEWGEVAEAWQRVTGEDISGGTPLWVSAFSDACGQVTSYRKGRVLIAGDAAHVQPPIGGQALNLGLQDAVNLGWKLAAAVRGQAPAAILNSYHAERHPVGKRVLGGIKAQAAVLLGGPEVAPLRAVLAELLGQEAVRRHFAGMISGLDVRYGDGPGLAGTRLPPLQLRTVHAAADGTRSASSTELLRTGRGLLIDLRGDPAAHAALREAASGWADRIDVIAGRPADDGYDSPGGIVLIRPDGHLAWNDPGARSGDSRAQEEPRDVGLQDALDRWFGPRRKGRPLPQAATTTHDRSDRMNKFEGKTALVTGASRGIGREIAERLAEEGALVAVHYATGSAAAMDVVAAIEKGGGRAFAVGAEFSNPGYVHRLFFDLERGLKERTGSAELNILVNNAGVMGGVPLDELTPEQFDRLYTVNAKAPFFITQRALANLTPGGRVISISSGLTRVANPDEVAYAMTKGAVEQLTLHFARYLAPRGITVNCVAPGITRNGSPVFDMPEAVEQMARLSAFNRVGEPRDIADVVAFLASADARWITGAFIDATGGTLLGG